MQPSRLQDRLRSSLWFVPALFGIGAVFLAVMLVRVIEASTIRRSWGSAAVPRARDRCCRRWQRRRSRSPGSYSRSPCCLAARERTVLPSSAADVPARPLDKITLGITIGTFTYSLLVLQSVHPRAPRAASSCLRSRYLRHCCSRSWRWRASSSTSTTSASRSRPHGYSQSGRGRDVRGDRPSRRHREPGSPGACGSRTGPGRSTAARDGVVVGVDERELVDLARSNACELTVVPSVGDPIIDGMPLLRSSVALEDEPVERAREAIEIAPERTMQQDVAFGLRQLIDIAERALSPADQRPHDRRARDRQDPRRPASARAGAARSLAGSPTTRAGHGSRSWSQTWRTSCRSASTRSGGRAPARCRCRAVCEPRSPT